MKTNQEVMGLFEGLLRPTSVRVDVRARPIAFELGDGNGTHDVWSFDPRRQDAMFAPGGVTSPALRIVCAPDVLWRVLTEDGFVPTPGTLRLEGDAQALQPLIDALTRRQQSAFDTRVKTGNKR